MTSPPPLRSVDALGAEPASSHSRKLRTVSHSLRCFAGPVLVLDSILTNRHCVCLTPYNCTALRTADPGTDSNRVHCFPVFSHPASSASAFDSYTPWGMYFSRSAPPSLLLLPNPRFLSRSLQKSTCLQRGPTPVLLPSLLIIR